MSTKALHLNLQIHLIVRSSVSMFQFLLVGRGTFMFQSLTWASWSFDLGRVMCSFAIESEQHANEFSNDSLHTTWRE
jgi:hypothetical protein